MHTFDTIIAGGIVVDGRRNPRYRADVAIKDGRVAAIGRLHASDAERVIDATGLIVAPGFVDLHTHYDAQIFWDPYCTISSYHGVTSVVIGNCGFGFAPVHPEDRDRAMHTLTRVEQIPYESMKAGLPWSWETFPEFLDALDGAPKGVNVLPYVGVNPLLSYVMGLEAAKTRLPTEEEHAEIIRIFDEALEAGACGWSAMRTPPGSFLANHVDFDGTPFPTSVMGDETAFLLTEAMSRRNTGFIQLTIGTQDPEADKRHVEKLAEIGRPILWNVVFPDGDAPELHRSYQDWFNRCRERGLSLYCQGLTVENSLIFSLDIWNLWDADDAWRGALIGSTQERMTKLSDPAVREELKQQMPVLFPLEMVSLVATDNPEFDKYLNMTLPQIAAKLDCHPVDALLDISLTEQLQTTWHVPVRAQADEYLRELIQDPYVIPGVSDGGAHTKMVTLARYPTEHLQLHVREHQWITLEEMHWKLSALPAWVAGFKDRGTITVGAPADVVIYDFDSLRMLPAEVAHDLPGNEWRRIQRAEGYHHILVNGETTFKDGICTGVLPGQLLRHGSGSPTGNHG
jgi:N-acyl-D-amino-acid deacylase